MNSRSYLFGLEAGGAVPQLQARTDAFPHGQTFKSIPESMTAVESWKEFQFKLVVPKNTINLDFSELKDRARTVMGSGVRAVIIRSYISLIDSRDGSEITDFRARCLINDPADPCPSEFRDKFYWHCHNGECYAEDKQVKRQYQKLQQWLTRHPAVDRHPIVADVYAVWFFTDYGFIMGLNRSNDRRKAKLDWSGDHREIVIEYFSNDSVLNGRGPNPWNFDCIEEMD